MPDHLVCQVVDQGEDDGVGRGHRHLGATGRQPNENTGSEKKEEHSHVQGHPDVHGLYLGG